MPFYPCAECGETYEQGRRRATPYCAECRARRKATNDRKLARERRARAVAENVADVLDDYVRQGMDPGYVDLMRDRLGDHLDDVVLIDEAPHPEPPLTGANTPAGPDEGFSTYFRDLGEDLDAHALDVAGHDWWAKHPNWWVGMHEDAPTPATAYLKAS